MPAPVRSGVRSRLCDDRKRWPSIRARLPPGAPRPPWRAPAPRRPRSRSSCCVRLLAIVLIAVGVLALLDAGVTLVWQEPISALIAKLHQDELSGDLRTVEHTAAHAGRASTLGEPRERAPEDRLPRSRARNITPATAAPVGRIVIPRIGASYVVVKGTDTGDLESGPGIYSETQVPRAARVRRRSPGTARRSWSPSVTSTRCATATESCSTCPTRTSPTPSPATASSTPPTSPLRSGTPATAASCSPPAHRCSAPPNGCSCTRA